MIITTDYGICKYVIKRQQLERYYEKIVKHRLEEALGCKITEDDEKRFEKISNELEGMIGIEYVDNLIEGWEEYLLKNGIFTEYYSGRALETVEEVRRALSEKGKVEFLANEKDYTVALVRGFRRTEKQGECKSK